MTTAQNTDGTIRGVVQDAGSNTAVEVVSTNRGPTRSEATSAGGSFDIGGLAPGSDEVRVLRNGAVVDTSNVDVSIGRATSETMATTQSVINEIVATQAIPAQPDSG